MSFLVPREYRKDISPRSGYLRNGSKWSKKSLKGLFMAEPNVAYLNEQLFILITHPQYVNDNSEAGPHLHKADWAGARSTIFGNTPYSGPKTPTKRTVAIITSFKRCKHLLSNLITDMIGGYELPFAEDKKTYNPIRQLHVVNKDFLVTSANNLIDAPEILDPGLAWLNLDTGVVEKPTEYDYGAASYSDGTWHPEHLFSENERNRRTAYWVPTRSEFWNGPVGHPSVPALTQAELDEAAMIVGKREAFSGPDELMDGSGLGIDTSALSAYSGKYEYTLDDPVIEKALKYESDRGKLYQPDNGFYADQYAAHPDSGGLGPGNKYKHIARAGDRRGEYDLTYNRSGTRHDLFSYGGQFPFWQITPQRREYDRRMDESLREGGESDRRTQPTRGYDMADLVERSSYQKERVPRQTYYGASADDTVEYNG